MFRSGENADRLADRTPSYWAALAAALVVTAAPAAFAQPQAAPPPADAPPVDAPPGEAPPGSLQSEEVVLEADVLIDDQTARTITAEGDVQARFQGRSLRADRMVYFLDTGAIRAQGNVEIIGANGTAQYADDIEVDEGLNVAVASELRARFGPSGALAARSAVRLGEGKSELRRVIYTSCPICTSTDRPPTWMLRARTAIQDPENSVISYRGATFVVTGVPVLYLPYFAHPDPSAGRHSGFLIPDFGRNRRLGTYYDQPYYWAISPHQDLTVSARTHTKVHPLFGFDYRKRFWSGSMRIQGTFTEEQDFDSSGNTFGDETLRSSLFAEGRFEVNDYWDWGFGAERISDDLYLRRYDLDGLTGPNQVRGPYIGQETRLISQLYAIGQDARSYTSASLVSFQGLRAGDGSDLLPVILPYLQYERVLEDPWMEGQVRVQANAAVLERSVGRDNARGSFGAVWRDETIFGPGIVASPFAEARADAFRVETTTPGEYESFTRTVGLGGVELSWPFMRAGENIDVIVEPVAMGAYASQGGNDPRILNEDSLGFELEETSLFRPSAAPNYDLWEPGARVSVGVRATARSHTGQSARLIFGRRWRDESDPAFTEQNNLEGTSSDWVGAASVNQGRNFATEVRVRLDDETLALQRLDVDVRGALWRFNGAARYYQINNVLAPGNPSEQVFANVGVELVRGWRAEFGVRRDLDLNTNIEQVIRALYIDDCTFLELSYSRRETFDRTLGPDEGFHIRIGLTSLGLFGAADGGTGN